ncbi:hypothetical protein BYT27DRAFT_7265322 [Phlegmacium glaucopus]|nr:hypothetical protein BYT27DRAFT_7265322 [Phlegmacium glaucopus]
MSSPVSASPDPDFDVERFTSPLPGTSTAPSSPPTHASECDFQSLGQSDYESTKDEVWEDNEPVAMAETETQRRLTRLQYVLDRSAVYSTILKGQMEEEKAKQSALRAEHDEQHETGKKRGRSNLNAPGKGKRKKGSNGEVVAVEADTDEEHEPPVFQQPSLVTGAKLKPYQLEGLQWMVSLDQNGISGILADEMGLGKTLQTIAFSAYLREQDNTRPFLVVCPLSVLHNWLDEYTKFAPDIPVCIYHGTPAERAELRRTVMLRPGSKPKTAKKPTKTAKTTRAQTKKTAKSRHKGRQGRSPAKAPEPLRRSGRSRKSTTIIIDSEDDDMEEEEPYLPEEDDRDDDEPEIMDVDTPALDDEDEDAESAPFPIVLTTYEMIIKDRVHLAHYNWGYIVVDEGHRLKNLDCKLMREIKKYKSAGRMILTGTPLHNNLAELWSLLNFILPDIFDDIDTFQEWFNLPELQSSLPTSQSSQIISSLHAILKPFLLRRMKVDVEMNLPPKKEYVLYAPLSVRQREAYDRVLDGGLRKWLIHGGTGGVEVVGDDEPIEEEASDEDEEQEGSEHRRASKRFIKGGRKGYAVDGDDDEYFESLERGNLDKRGLKVIKTKEEEEAEEAKIGREHQLRTKVKQVNNMKLQNTVMQLRKVCSHPFLFDWPIDPNTRYPVLGEELVNASGKMMVLDRLLRELFKRGHKVLLFSQFTTMLDIIEEWAVDYMGWSICRIDGSTAPLDRREEMNRFQNGGDDPDAPRLFLLSTRAGGLGINLVAADTVIFYDQDWNPQMDAQAQDRAHRIGQTRPVLIFRLVSAHTVETKIMQRATEKRKLEVLIIAKGQNYILLGVDTLDLTENPCTGKFKMPAAAAPSTKKESIAEMAAALLRLEGEKIEVVPNTKEGKQGVLSDADLDVLLDRRPEVFSERRKGWISSSATGGAQDVMDHHQDVSSDVDHAAVGAGKKAAFAVYEAPVEEGK